MSSQIYNATNFTVATVMSSYQNGCKHTLLINDSSLSVFPKIQGYQYIISISQLVWETVH